MYTGPKGFSVAREETGPDLLDVNRCRHLRRRSGFPTIGPVISVIAKFESPIRPRAAALLAFSSSLRRPAYSPIPGRSADDP